MGIDKGIWWTNTEQTAPKETVWRAELAGDMGAWRRGRLQLWRWQWKWHLFKVDLDCCPPDASQGYYVYCQTEGDSMRARRWIRTSYFFARLGPEDVTFWAANEGRNHYQPLPIQHLGDGDSSQKWTVDGHKRPESRKFLCNWGRAVSV